MTLSPSAYGHGAPIAAPIGLPAETRVTRAVKVEVDYQIRCQGVVDIRSRPGEQKVCGKLLAEHAGRPWRVKCSRCGTVNQSSQMGKGPGNL